MAKDTKKQWSEYIGSKAFFNDFLHIRENRLKFILKRKQKSIKLKVVETLMKVVQRVIELRQIF